jgi:hypothetical protein
MGMLTCGGQKKAMFIWNLKRNGNNLRNMEGRKEQ